MRKVILFIAMSLDGYIADEKGSVGWLNGQDISAENIDTYSVFVRDVDTVILGWDTYHQIVTHLSPGDWIVNRRYHRYLPRYLRSSFTTTVMDSDPNGVHSRQS